MTNSEELKEYFELDADISKIINTYAQILNQMGLIQMARALEIADEENAKLNKEFILELKSILL